MARRRPRSLGQCFGARLRRFVRSGDAWRVVRSPAMLVVEDLWSSRPQGRAFRSAHMRLGVTHDTPAELGTCVAHALFHLRASPSDVARALGVRGQGNLVLRCLQDPRLSQFLGEAHDAARVGTSLWLAHLLRAALRAELPPREQPREQPMRGLVHVNVHAPGWP